jgi:hypothetical protein
MGCVPFGSDSEYDGSSLTHWIISTGLCSIASKTIALVKEPNISSSQYFSPTPGMLSEQTRIAATMTIIRPVLIAATILIFIARFRERGTFLACTSQHVRLVERYRQAKCRYVIHQSLAYSLLYPLVADCRTQAPSPSVPLAHVCSLFAESLEGPIRSISVPILLRSSTTSLLLSSHCFVW